MPKKTKASIEARAEKVRNALHPMTAKRLPGYITKNPPMPPAFQRAIDRRANKNKKSY